MVFKSLKNNDSRIKKYKNVLSVGIRDHDVTPIFKEVVDSFFFDIRVYDFMRYVAIRTALFSTEGMDIGHDTIFGSTLGSKRKGISTYNLCTDSLEIVDDENLDTHTFKANVNMKDIRI
jgi:hypothetical protein